VEHKFSVNLFKPTYQIKKFAGNAELVGS